MTHRYLFLLLSLCEVYGGPLKQCPERYLQDPAVTRFRKYIHIDTSREQNIHRAVEFWRQQAVELGLPFNVFTPGGLPVCVITVLGTDPSLPSIMLNSHMDVVPAIENEWTYPPYSAYIDEQGDIYGRGTQDTKDIACQYMEAVRRLKKENVKLKRNLHITLMPDEETGGFRGIKPFVKSEAFKAMNVGFALDEGLASTDDVLLATYQDRRPWQLQVTVHGEGGHGAGMPDNTAMDKARRFMNVVNDYRDRMKAVMRSSDPIDFGRYTSLNINIVAGGLRPNIIASGFSMVIDMRLSTDTDIAEMEHMVKLWIAEAGNGTELTFIRREDVSAKTILNDSNPYWVAMRDAVNEIGLSIIALHSPGTSDGMVLRNMGISVVGFSTKTATITRAHAKNEYQNAEVFLRGIDIYYAILKKLGNLPHFEFNNFNHDTL